MSEVNILLDGCIKSNIDPNSVDKIRENQQAILKNQSRKQKLEKNEIEEIRSEQ